MEHLGLRGIEPTPRKQESTCYYTKDGWSFTRIAPNPKNSQTERHGVCGKAEENRNVLDWVCAPSFPIARQ